MTTFSIRDRVRLEIGDTDVNQPLFYDDEIDAYLADYNQGILATAAALCDVLSTRLAGDYDFKWMDQSFSRSQASEAYAKRAASIRSRIPGVGLGVIPTTRVDGYSQDIPNRETSSLGIGRRHYRDRRY
jgi:hypothetical protein